MIVLPAVCCTGNGNLEYNFGMSIHIHATYRDGVIHPEHPLGLPNDTPLDVLVTPVTKDRQPPTLADSEELPVAPKISAEQFREIIKRHAVAVGTLPPDFSRSDIYQDHD